MDKILSLSNDVESITYNPKTKICDLCKEQYKKIFSLLTRDNRVYNMCGLCKIAYVYSKSDSYKCILMMSKMSQNEIIKRTVGVFNSCGHIASPREIDPKAKRLNISTQNTRCLMSMDEDVAKRLKKKNIKVFFTPDINLSSMIVRNIFSAKATYNNNFWDDLHSYPKFNLSSKFRQIMDKRTEISRQNDYLFRSKERFTSKVNKINNLLDAMSEHADYSVYDAYTEDN